MTPPQSGTDIAFDRLRDSGRAMSVLRALRLPALLLALVAAGPAPAAAVWPFSSTTTTPAGSETAPASSIPAPEVAQRAEEAGKVLRDVETLLAPGPGVAAIERRLPDIGERLVVQAEETNRQLADRRSAAVLEGLASQWQAARAEVATYVNVLAERATALERSWQRLTGLRETWTQARTDARASRAPAPVFDRIDGILAGIDDTRKRLQEERAAMLVLQDTVAQHVARCDEAIARLATARNDMAGRLLVRGGVPLWSLAQLGGAVTELPGRLRTAAEGALFEIRQFAYDQQPRLYGDLALFAGFCALTFAARRTARAIALEGAVPGLAALEHPVAAALLLTVLANTLSMPQSRVVPALGGLIVLVPAVRIARTTVDVRLVGALRPLGVLLAADLLRQLASTVPLLEQHIFLLEVIGLLGAAGWKLRRHWEAVVARMAGWSRAARIAAATPFVAMAGAGVAAAAGYVRLALFIGAGLLGSLSVALVLYAGVKVARALITVGLYTPPLLDLRMVRTHRPLLERQAERVLLWLAVGGWAILVLRHFALWPFMANAVETALSAEVRRGALSVSLGGLLMFAVTIAVTVTLSAIVRFVLREELYPRVAPERALPHAISALVHYTLIFAGLLLGLAALGVDLTKITIVAGGLGVGIGFGLQGLVRDFVSGLVVLSERRINVGDAVQIGQVGGEVQALGMRACTIRTWEGAEVIVPNASLVSDSVANWTLSDRLRRIDCAVGVAYGTSPERVADLLLAVARKHADVLLEPAPVVLLVGFGDSALRFELRTWTRRFERWLQIRSELSTGVYAALRDAGIDIPLPQQEVRLLSGPAG